MVHALREAWRVLRPEGALVDLRPLAREANLELVHDGSASLACSRDSWKALPDDAACERSLDRVIGEGLFALERRLDFECALWWESAEEWLLHSRTHVQRWDPPSQELATTVRERMAASATGTRLRMHEHLSAARYRRSLPGSASDPADPARP